MPASTDNRNSSKSSQALGQNRCALKGGRSKACCKGRKSLIANRISSTGQNTCALGVVGAGHGVEGADAGGVAVQDVKVGTVLLLHKLAQRALDLGVQVGKRVDLRGGVEKKSLSTACWQEGKASA